MRDPKDTLSIVVVGASGDLARKKIFPALFALYSQGLLPDRTRLFGFARSRMDDHAFRERVASHLTCRYVPGASCEKKISDFLSNCFYVSGQYDSADAFLDLYTTMRDQGDAAMANRLFYLAIPPSVFLGCARAIGDAGFVACGLREAWSRVVIEKPFGRDRSSSDELTRELANVFTENQTYRIDHYLGKEAIQNLMVLRFANVVFEPVWTRDYVEEVSVVWQEEIGVGDRGGYYDSYGILRDVVQNHLLQILALVAMERPRDAGALSVRNEKVRLLRSIRPPTLDDVVLGQYGPGRVNGVDRPGYTENDSVPKGSLTPTFASLRLHVENARWAGVPFLIRAGKALDHRLNEVRLRFRGVPDNIFEPTGPSLPGNTFVIRIQPDEALNLRVLNKAPGLDLSLVESDLNLRYQSVFSGVIPDAYERLLLDVIQGDKSLFIRADELAAAWDIFTPVLHAIDAAQVSPKPYDFGSAGPEA